MFCLIAHSSSAKVVLTSAQYDYASKLGSLQNALNCSLSSVEQEQWPQNLNWIVTDQLFLSFPAADIQTDSTDFSESHCNIAFLQYTSGSTSDPKGVMISQNNLTDNLNLITSGLSADTDTVVVSWLPQYHDMGLIGSYLGVLYCGGSGYYLSPVSFIRNPSLWITSMSRYKATHIQAPNFAYALTAKKFLAQTRSRAVKKNEKAIDLSSVRHMINAGEVTA